MRLGEAYEEKRDNKAEDGEGEGESDKCHKVSIVSFTNACPDPASHPLGLFSLFKTSCGKWQVAGQGKNKDCEWTIGHQIKGRSGKHANTYQAPVLRLSKGKRKEKSTVMVEIFDAVVAYAAMG